MKMHLAVAAALIGLSSHAAFAASEGGDTWSRLEPRGYSGYAPVMTVATTARLSSLQREAASSYGTASTPAATDRVVQLSPSMKWVDVGYGDHVTFMYVDEHGAQRSFAWKFDVSPVRTHVDLQDVAPADFPAQVLRVFVAADPAYRGG